MKTFKSACLAIGSVAAFCFVIYGCYWVAKTVSYSVFYEDMVVQTIKETVKAEYLTGG